jgi:hypothetical protein
MNRINLNKINSKYYTKSLDYNKRVNEALSLSRKARKKQKDINHRRNPLGFIKKKNSSAFVPSVTSDFYPEIKKGLHYLQPVPTFSSLQVEKRPYFELPEMSGITHKVFTPEVDGLKWYTKNTTVPNFFTKLKEFIGETNKSWLIDYFAQCEEQNLPYVYDNFCFIKTHSIKGKKDGIEENRIVYFVNGGFREIHRLAELDLLFLGSISYYSFQVEDHFYQLQEIHICSDWTCNLIKFIKNAIKKGHLQTNGHHPLAIGVRDGKKFTEKCGQQSKNWKKFKDENYDLESLYIGAHRTNEESISMYSKKKKV